MTMIPLLHTDAIAPTVKFYTDVLGFTCVGIWPEAKDPGYAVLLWGEDELHLSSHSGDGRAGNAVIVLTSDVNAVFQSFIAAGLDQSHRTESPVHLGPVEQTWGTIEYYVDDPGGNRLIFTQRVTEPS